MLTSAVENDSPTYKKQCGRRLRAVRLALNFNTIRGFATETSVEEDTLGAWESGQNMVQAYYVLKLKQEYGVTFEWIFDGDPKDLPYSLAVPVLEQASSS